MRRGVYGIIEDLYAVFIRFQNPVVHGSCFFDPRPGAGISKSFRRVRIQKTVFFHFLLYRLCRQIPDRRSVSSRKRVRPSLSKGVYFIPRQFCYGLFICFQTIFLRQFFFCTVRQHHAHQYRPVYPVEIFIPLFPGIFRQIFTSVRHRHITCAAEFRRQDILFIFFCPVQRSIIPERRIGKTRIAFQRRKIIGFAVRRFFFRDLQVIPQSQVPLLSEPDRQVRVFARRFQFLRPQIRHFIRSRLLSVLIDLKIQQPARRISREIHMIIRLQCVDSRFIRIYFHPHLRCVRQHSTSGQQRAGQDKERSRERHRLCGRRVHHRLQPAAYISLSAPHGGGSA